MTEVKDKPSYFNERHTFSYLDGLRGIAALFVVFCHLCLWFYPALVDGRIAYAHNPHEVTLYQLPISLLWGGNFAVCVFFVLSGFVLSYKFLKTKDPEVLSSGAFRRYPRLMIPVLGSVLIAYMCVSSHLFWSNQQVNLNMSPPEVTTFWTQTGGLFAALYQGLIGVFTQQYAFPQHFNGVLWTMYYEFIGSFIVFGILALFGNRNLRSLVYVLLALAFLDSYFLAFIIGMVFAELHVSRRKDVFRISAKKGWILLAAGITLGTLPYGTPDAARYVLTGNAIGIVGDGLTLFLRVIGAAIVVYCTLSLVRVQDFLRNRGVLFFGRISFSLYLLHVFVIAIWAKRFFYYCSSYLHLPYKVSFLATSATTLVIASGLAYIYTVYVDERAIVLSRKWYILAKTANSQELIHKQLKSVQRSVARNMRGFVSVRPTQAADEVSGQLKHD